MGRSADENLPEVVPPQQYAYHSHPQYSSAYPEVVPDSSPEAGHPPLYTDQQQEKYPAQYDNAPKYAYEQQPPPGTPGTQYGSQYGSQYQQTWGEAGQVSGVTPASSVPWQRLPSDAAEHPPTIAASEPEPEPRICGIRRRLFFIIAGILGVIIIAAAVGGGVGGAVSSRAGSNSNEAAETESTTSAIPTSTETSASTSASTSTSTTSSAPTTTGDPNFLPDIMDTLKEKTYAFQGFSKAKYKGERTPILREEGYYDFDFEVVSYVWWSNGNQWTDCCVTYCFNKTTSGGYGCQSRNQTGTDEPFRRAFIYCGRSNVENRKKCQPKDAATTKKASDSSASFLGERNEFGHALLDY